MSAKLGVVPRATGSALLDHGHTKVGAHTKLGGWRVHTHPPRYPRILVNDPQVLASVYGPRECASRSKEEHNRSIINCQVVMAPFAMVSRGRLCASVCHAECQFLCTGSGGALSRYR
jgi:hypothetical protein